LDADEEVQAEAAARDRELKDNNEATFTHVQLDALIEKAVAADRAERPLPGASGQMMPVDPDAPDPETGRAPAHVIAEWDAKRQAGIAALAAEKAAKA